MRVVNGAGGVLLSLMLTGCMGVSSVSVVNRGVPGENTAEISRRLHEALIDVHPGYVVLFAGMNDAVNEKKFLPVLESVKNVEAMLAEIRSAHAVPILILVQHVDTKRVLARHDAKLYGAEGPNGKIDRLDDGLQALALRRKVMTVDFRASLEKAGGANAALSTDGVHMTEAGYRLLAETVLGALPKTLPQGTKILCVGDSLTYGVGLGVRGKATYPEQLGTMLSARGGR